MKIRSTIVSLAALLLLASVSLISKEIATTAATKVYTACPTIIVDAGHGGFDGGAVAGDGTLEKDINLAIAQKLGTILKTSGYDVHMTRTTDTATDYSEQSTIRDRKIKDMKNRLKLINETENCIFISVHLNKFTSGSARGAQVFYSPNADESNNLGESIQNSIIKMLQPENTRKIKPGTKDTYLLYYAENPAVIVECGFVSNPAELELLKNEKYQEKIAFSIFCGIADYLK